MPAVVTTTAVAAGWTSSPSAPKQKAPGIARGLSIPVEAYVSAATSAAGRRT